MGSPHKNIQLIPGSILAPILSLLYINDLPVNVICNIVIYPDDAAYYSNCNFASDLWYQLELTYKLESDLRDTGLGQEVAY